MKKLDNVKKDHEKRLDSLQKAQVRMTQLNVNWCLNNLLMYEMCKIHFLQEDDKEKARLIEINLPLVSVVELTVVILSTYWK